MHTVLPSPCAQSGVPCLRKRSRSLWFRLPAPSAAWLLRSPVNPNHAAPSHGPPARVLSPLSSWQSLSCCLSLVAKRSTPKPHGPLYFPSEPCGPFPHFRTMWPSSFPLRTSWFSLPLLQNHMDLFLSTCFKTSWSSSAKKNYFFK